MLTPTHRCKECGALWSFIPSEDFPSLGKSPWKLHGKTCETCCDNNFMGGLIELLTAQEKEKMSNFFDFTPNIPEMTNLFDFKTSTSEFFVNRLGMKVRIYARDCGPSKGVHGAYLSNEFWQMAPFTEEGNSPTIWRSAYDIVGEWREPHPAESWPQGKIVEVSAILGGSQFLRRFYEYDIENQVFKCFKDGEDGNGEGELYDWKFAKEPK